MGDCLCDSSSVPWMTLGTIKITEVARFRRVFTIKVAPLMVVQVANVHLVSKAGLEETHYDDTVDGKNPSPVDRRCIPFFTRFCTSQVVQDFFHQQ